MTHTIPKGYLTTGQVAKRLDCSGHTIRKFISSGRLKAIQPLGTRRLVKESDLALFIEANPDLAELIKENTPAV